MFLFTRSEREQRNYLLVLVHMYSNLFGLAKGHLRVDHVEQCNLHSKHRFTRQRKYEYLPETPNDLYDDFACTFFED